MLTLAKCACRFLAITAPTFDGPVSSGVITATRTSSNFDSAWDGEAPVVLALALLALAPTTSSVACS